ncbi:hypothetical protein M885DRAFT_514962 [Pelagophyceae sp. CCMP2097]|nr:hypothetical protein M885DRAFT_514962 [Pelagophyceae sp. CCMP2097]|mmetsp:Transcript_8968/g.30869  ORF Transcript_8968/g.30869 Transcript_8968/m.30869 type:complete len:373 (-) Transcript_8968:16-1134(-)
MDLLLAAAAAPSPTRSRTNWSAAQSLAGLAAQEDGDAASRWSGAVSMPSITSLPRRTSARRKRRIVGDKSEGASDDDVELLSDDGCVTVSPSIVSNSFSPSSLLQHLAREREEHGLDALSMLSRSAPTHTSLLSSRHPLLRAAMLVDTGEKRARTMSEVTVECCKLDSGDNSPDRDDLQFGSEPAPRPGTTPGKPAAGRARANTAEFVDARRSTLVDGVPQPLSLEAPARPLMYDDLINFPRSRGKSHARRCVMCGHLASGEAATCSIPLQNKDVCKRCDTGIWSHHGTGEYFKWCKGCKKFLHVCAFSEKLSKCATKYSKQPSKCDRCRERGRQSYMSKRMEVEPGASPAVRALNAPPPPPASLEAEAPAR